jgi:hypothetical protein
MDPRAAPTNASRAKGGVSAAAPTHHRSGRRASGGAHRQLTAPYANSASCLVADNCVPPRVHRSPSRPCAWSFRTPRSERPAACCCRPGSGGCVWRAAGAQRLDLIHRFARAGSLRSLARRGSTACCILARPASPRMTMPAPALHVLSTLVCSSLSAATSMPVRACSAARVMRSRSASGSAVQVLSSANTTNGRGHSGVSATVYLACRGRRCLGSRRFAPPRR